MDVELGPAVKALVDNLAALYEAAGTPTLKSIVDHCEANDVTVRVGSIQEWITGKYVPAKAKPFGKMIRYLELRAQQRTSSYRCPPAWRWEEMRLAAKQERDSARGRRNKSGAASTTEGVATQDSRAVLGSQAALMDLVELRGGAGDELPTISELDPYQLKATPSEFGDSSTYGVNDPYVPRTHGNVDDKVASALAGKQLLLLIGPSKAGKTRTLFEAVRKELPTARVVVADPKSLTQLPGCEQYRNHADTLVVWLENLDEFLTGDRALTPRLLAALTARRSPTVVVATLRTEKYNELRAGGELARDIRTVFEQARRIELAPTSASPAEQAVAAALYPSLDLTHYGLAEMLVGAPALLEHYRRGNTAGRVSTQIAAFTAVIEVVIDWARIGRLDRIPEERLIELARDVIDTRYSAYDITDDDLAASIADARLPHEGAGQTTAITSKWLKEPRVRGYRPFDYLVAADDIDGRAIPDAFWDRATADADAENLNSVGFHAYFRSSPLTALDLFHRSAEMDHPEAMHNLGVISEYQGEVDDARTWYERSADLGHVDAMCNLGTLLAEQGELGDAEFWTQYAADAGHFLGMYNLGVLAHERGNLDEAETWYRRSAGLGHTDAMYNLATLLSAQDNGDEAEHWWKRAAIVDHGPSLYVLGLLFMRRDDQDNAKALWRLAAKAGHPSAMYNLGIFHLERSDLDEAAMWFVRAGAAGYTAAEYNLRGIAHARRGEHDLAQGWYLLADNAGPT